MKKMIFTVLVVASTTVGLNAQNMQAVTPAQGQPAMQGQTGRPMTPPAPEERAKRMTDHLNQVVKLTPEQTKKVSALYKEASIKQDDLRKEAQAGGSGASIGPKFKALNDNTEAKLKEILTADQFAKYQESRHSRMNTMNGARPGMAPATAPTNGGQH